MLGRGPSIQVVTITCPHAECDEAEIEAVVDLASELIEEARGACPHVAALVEDDAFVARALGCADVKAYDADRAAYERAVDSRIDSLLERGWRPGFPMRGGER